MSRRKVAPWLLAASVFLTGATTMLGTVTPAHAITSVEELRDVDSSNWAYQALSDLVEKYDVIEGYPDYTFKGKKPATRWEMAAALNAVMKAVGRDIARLGAEKANKSDLATLARLQEEFRNELAALNSRTSALESRASAIEAKNQEQDTRLSLLEKTQLHGDLSLGVLYNTAGNGQGDGISTLGRMRLGLKVPVVQGYDNSPVGEGDVIARLVGAFGRWGGSNTSASGNTGAIGGFSEIAGDSSGNDGGVGSRTGSTGLSGLGLNLRQALYIESAYYKQHFKSGIPILTDVLPGISLFPNNDNWRTTADLYAGVIPWRNLFDRSPYRGDELNQFQNTSLVNNAGFLINNVEPTLAMAWHQGLGTHFSADLTGALSTLDSANVVNGWDSTEELALNYDTSFLGHKYTKPGTLYGGSYQVFFSGRNSNDLATLTGLGLTNRSGGLLYPGGANDKTGSTLLSYFVGMNQEFWRGIGGSVSWVANTSNANNALLEAYQNGTGVNASYLTGGHVVGIRDSLNAVASVPLTVFNKNLTHRAHDLIGFGYSWIQPENQIGETAGHSDEHDFELFYRWAVNNSMTIIPSAQLVINRFGVSSNGADYVVGLRTNYVF